MPAGNTIPERKNSVPINRVRLNDSFVASWKAVEGFLGRFPKGAKTTDGLLTRKLSKDRGEMQELWQSFTEDRGSLGRKLLQNWKSISSYHMGFHMVNGARAKLVLDRADLRCNLRRRLEAHKKVAVFDLGCGTGSVSQVVAGWLGQTVEMTVDLFDQNRMLLECATKGLEGIRKDITVTAHRFGLEDWHLRDAEALAKRQSANFYCLGYVWNELEKNPRARSKLMKQFEYVAETKAPSYILFLEPANQNPSREAMAWRDAMVECGLQIIYPCPQSGACPMLERSRDWCYGEADWDRPMIQKKIDRELGVDRGRLAVTGFLLANRAAISSGEPLPALHEVIVGRPTNRESGSFSYLVCDQGELKAVEPNNPVPQLRGLQLQRNLPSRAKADLKDKAPSTSGSRRVGQSSISDAGAGNRSRPFSKTPASSETGSRPSPQSKSVPKPSSRANPQPKSDSNRKSDKHRES